MRPLDRLRSIKLKLSVVIVAAVAISALVSTIGWRTGIDVWFRPVIAVGLALLLVYPFSRGITSPLREMADAATAMAEGDFGRPVSVDSRDEVGELARTFVAMRAELAEVDRQRRALIANVAHELRTPLTGLRARLENVVDGVEPNDLAHAAASLAEIERLSLLVDRVLDLSRLEAGSSPLHVEHFDVAPLLCDAAEAAAAGCAADRLVVRCRDDLAYTGDRMRVHQVVVNLVANAVRFAPDGPVEVEARADGDGIRLVVVDRGPGIAEAERDRVVERFYRTDDARSSALGGTGLGLAIVSEIVELHGGSIEFTTNHPTGCRVEVRLPDVQGEERR